MKSSARLFVSNLWLALSSSPPNPASMIPVLKIPLGRSSVLSSSSSLSLSSLAASNNDNTRGEGERTRTNTTNNSKDNDNDATALSNISMYHPVVIEGMGYYDPRDPKTVAATIVASIQKARAQRQRDNNSDNTLSKPLLVITQGDPLSPRGISAITPLVGESLSNNARGLVCLDASIDPSHSKDADRTNVVVEVWYSQLVEILKQQTINVANDDNNNNNNKIQQPLLEALEIAIDEHIAKQNRGRATIGKPPVKDYFKTYALLQEVTKAGLKQLCGGSITIAHTSAELNPFSVTSFCAVGLALGLYNASEIVAYDTTATNTTGSVKEEQQEPTVLDFSTIDPR